MSEARISASLIRLIYPVECIEEKLDAVYSPSDDPSAPGYNQHTEYGIADYHHAEVAPVVQPMKAVCS